MTFQPGSNLYSANAGYTPENIEVPFYSNRAPTVNDTANGFFPVGKRWIDIGVAEYVLLSISTVAGITTANWSLLGTNTGALNTLTGDSGGAITPVSNNITLAGTSNQIATAGSAGTITFSLIGPYTPTTYTAHSVLLGEGTSSISSVGPNAASGIPLISQGVGSDPIFGTALVPGGGTGKTTFTAYSVITAGTTATGAFQNVVGVGTSGQVLVSNGAGALPSWQAITAEGAITTIDGDAGSMTPTVGVVTINGGTTGLTTSASASTMSLTGTLVVANGGTGAATLTSHGVLVGAGTAAVSGLTAGTNGQVLVGSTGANPAFATLTTSTGIGFTTGAASLALNIVQDGYKIDAASTGVALVAQNAYTVTQAAQTSFSLPATAAVGDRFVIASATGNTSGWIITQGASQEIWAGTSHTTNGATGTLAGAIHTCVELMCVVANNEFIVIGGSGLTGLTFV